MNILVCIHELEMGGSQLNAIELAAAVRDRGYNVTIAAPKGVLLSLISELGLNYLPTIRYKGYPSIRTALRLTRMVRELEIDLVHAYEWRPSIEAAFGPHLFRGTPLLMTNFSMEIPDSLPRHVPIVVGTRELMELPGREVSLMEPPIDIEKNKLTDRAAARSIWGFQDGEIVVGIICRMTHDLGKAEGVLEAMDVIASLARRSPMRMLVVGDGESLDLVREKAERVNSSAGREVVVITGLMLDSRDAYAASDIMLGQGMSALRSMSFSRPLVVHGLRGYWRLVDEESVGTFYHQGFFGNGGRGAKDLEPILAELAADVELRSRLGAFGRKIVEERYSLGAAADWIVERYQQVVADQRPFISRLPSLSRSSFVVYRLRIGNALMRARRIYEATRGEVCRSP